MNASFKIRLTKPQIVFLNSHPLIGANSTLKAGVNNLDGNVMKRVYHAAYDYNCHSRIGVTKVKKTIHQSRMAHCLFITASDAVFGNPNRLVDSSNDI